MKRFHRIILMIILAMFVTASFAACGKKDEEPKKELKEQEEGNNQVTPTEAQQAEPTVTMPPTIDTFSVKSVRHETMPIEMEVPEAAKVSESQDDLTAETEDYMLYAYGMNNYNNALLNDVMDIVSVMNEDDHKVIAADMLRLRDYSVPENAEAKLYDNINGVSGFLCPLSNMEYENRSGEKCQGDGFAMIYTNKSGVGLYVVLGILKNTAAAGEVQDMLRACALSLRQDEVEGDEYVIWTETMPDGVDVKASFKTDLIKTVEEADKGYCLYYDEDQTGYFLIQHFTKVGRAGSKEYLQSIIDELGKKGVKFSEPEEVVGKMTYQKATMTYTADGTEIQEVVCVSVNEGGSVWIVDLYGTSEQVKGQQDNLAILLGSLQED